MLICFTDTSRAFNREETVVFKWRNWKLAERGAVRNISLTNTDADVVVKSKICGSQRKARDLGKHAECTWLHG